MKTNWRLEYRPEYIRESQRHIKRIFLRKPFSTYAGKDYDPAQDAPQGTESGESGEGEQDTEDDEENDCGGLQGMRIKGKSEIEIAVRLYVADLVEALDSIIDTAAAMVDEGHLDTEGFKAISEKVQLIQDRVTE